MAPNITDRSPNPVRSLRHAHFQRHIGQGDREMSEPLHEKSLENDSVTMRSVQKLKQPSASGHVSSGAPVLCSSDSIVDCRFNPWLLSLVLFFFFSFLDIAYGAGMRTRDKLTNA